MNDFVEKASALHNNKYNYDKVIYVNSKIKVIITCPFHGDFLQTPNSHLSNKGCAPCGYQKVSLLRRKSLSEFIIQANNMHNNKYLYDKVNYINSYTTICITCVEHGDYWQAPNNHLNGVECPSCASISTSECIKRAIATHGNLYDYSKVVCRTARDNICIICKKHGEFFQKAYAHYYNGNHCPKCRGQVSRVENEWIESLGLKLKRQCTVYINDKRFLVDGFDPATNTVYEFYGDYWHGNPQVYLSTDCNLHNNKTFGELFKSTLDKTNLLKQKYNVVVMWEFDWKKSKAL